MLFSISGAAAAASSFVESVFDIVSFKLSFSSISGVVLYFLVLITDHQKDLFAYPLLLLSTAHPVLISHHYSS